MDLTSSFHRWLTEMNNVSSNYTFVSSNYTFVISFLLLVAIMYFITLGKRHKLNLPPSPSKLPIIGNFHQIGEPLHRSLHALSQKHGPVTLLHLGSAPYIIVSSPDLAKEIMKSSGAFSNRGQTRVGKTLFKGCTDIAFSRVGDYWRQAKKICVLELLSQKRVQAFQFAREDEVGKMVEKIRGSCADVVDLTQMFETVSNNIVSISAFGKVHERSDGKKSFAEVSKNAMDLIGAFCFQDIIPCLGWLDYFSGLTKKLKETSDDVDAFMEQVIQEHRSSRVYTSDDKSEKKDLVDILLDLQRDGMLDPVLTQDNLKAILLDMFFGGTDSTATTMEWLMAELMKNPTIMKKAQEEVRRIVGKKPKISEGDISQMEYLKCMVKETLRLHSPFMITRQTDSSAKLGGYDIPANTFVFVNSWAIQRDPSLWDSPEEFIPERFLNSSFDYRSQHREFMPFGGTGKRSCPGTSFAVAEVEYVIANLLYWFDWKLPGGLTAEELDMSDTFALVIRKSVPLSLVPTPHVF